MADYRLPGEYMYHGMVLQSITTEDTLSRLPDLDVTSGDVLIASYPKTGTTWMENLSWLISNNGQETETPLHQRIYYLETKLDGITSGLDLLKDSPRPAIMKTHVQGWMFKRQIEEGPLKIIVVIRNPKDTLASFYNFYKMNRSLGDFKGTFADFFELYKAKHLLYGDYFEWYASWIPFLKLPNVELVSYEDMTYDMSGVIQRLAIFLEKEVSAALEKQIVQKTSFDQMKNNKLTNYEEVPIFDFGISPFMRKGKVGDWKNYFTDEQSALVDEHYNHHLLNKNIKLRFE